MQSETQSKLDKGHNLIIQGGFNYNYKDLHKRMLKLGINDIIAKQHGKGPTTYNRSSDSPIDHIFCTANLTITNGGFLANGKLLSDHRGLWVDIPNHMLFGYNPPQPEF